MARVKSVMPPSVILRQNSNIQANFYSRSLATAKAQATHRGTVGVAMELLIELAYENQCAFRSRIQPKLHCPPLLGPSTSASAVKL